MVLTLKNHHVQGEGMKKYIIIATTGKPHGNQNPFVLHRYMLVLDRNFQLRHIPF